MHLSGVAIDSRSALGAEVAVTRVEIERTDAVFAASTLEPYLPFPPIGSVVCHRSIVALWSDRGTHYGGLSKVTSLLLQGQECCNQAIYTPLTIKVSHGVNGSPQASHASTKSEPNAARSGHLESWRE